jgi:hypothetical protein
MCTTTATDVAAPAASMSAAAVATAASVSAAAVASATTASMPHAATAAFGRVCRARQRRHKRNHNNPEF